MHIHIPTPPYVHTERTCSSGTLRDGSSPPSTSRRRRGRSSASIAQALGNKEPTSTLKNLQNRTAERCKPSLRELEDSTAWLRSMETKRREEHARARASGPDCPARAPERTERPQGIPSGRPNGGSGCSAGFCKNTIRWSCDEEIFDNRQPRAVHNWRECQSPATVHGADAAARLHVCHMYSACCESSALRLLSKVTDRDSEASTKTVTNGWKQPEGWCVVTGHGMPRIWVEHCLAGPQHNHIKWHPPTN